MFSAPPAFDLREPRGVARGDFQKDAPAVAADGDEVTRAPAPRRRHRDAPCSVTSVRVVWFRERKLDDRGSSLREGNLAAVKSLKALPSVEHQQVAARRGGGVVQNPRVRRRPRHARASSLVRTRDVIARRFTNRLGRLERLETPFRRVLERQRRREARRRERVVGRRRKRSAFHSSQTEYSRGVVARGGDAGGEDAVLERRGAHGEDAARSAGHHSRRLRSSRISMS
jgi:hypothetical protein